jgi:hypothetical protein
LGLQTRCARTLYGAWLVLSRRMSAGAVKAASRRTPRRAGREGGAMKLEEIEHDLENLRYHPGFESYTISELRRLMVEIVKHLKELERENERLTNKCLEWLRGWNEQDGRIAALEQQLRGERLFISDLREVLDPNKPGITDKECRQMALDLVVQRLVSEHAILASAAPVPLSDASPMPAHLKLKRLLGFMDGTCYREAAECEDGSVYVREGENT